MFYRTRITLAAIALTGSIVLAQDNTPAGLDALSDSKLLGELSNRNLKTLLDRAFEINKTPEAERAAIVGRMALQRLRLDASIPLPQVRKLVAEYVKSVDALLNNNPDPRVLIEDANILIQSGIESDKNLIEYFGPSAGPMSRMRPVADAVQKMLTKSQALAEAEMEKAANNWPAGEKDYDRAELQKQVSEFFRNDIAYAAALATDKSDATRSARIDAALEFMQQFDTEEAQNRASLKFSIARLHLAKAIPQSLKLAVADFDFVQKNGDPKDVGKQFESRFLQAMAQIELKDTAGATQKLSGIEAWSKSAGIDATQLQVAISALRFRIALASNDPATADDILDKLQQARPELRGLILELMSARVKPDAPMTSLNPLLLQAITAKATAETVKPQGEKFDDAAVRRGVEAANELLKRKPSAQVVDDNLYTVGFFHQKLGENLAAATAYLAYVDANKKDADKTKAERVQTSFNNTIAVVGELFRTRMGEPAITKLYDRVLSTAVVAPFERMEFAYEYARRLQANDKFNEAVVAFRKVPKDDRNASEAQYYLMVAVKQQVDSVKPDDAKRPQLLTELSTLIDGVNASLTNKLATETDAKRKIVWQTRLAQTRLLGADVALRDQKDASRATKLLEGFEQTATGLPGASQLLGEALLIRVQGFVQLGNVSQATEQLVLLADKNPDTAGNIVYNLLQKLDEQVTAAEAAGRNDTVADLERNRALLTPFLVKWASTHKREEIRKLTYTYSVFDADTQRRAAELTPEPVKRKQLLEAALKRFTELDGAESLKQYIESLPAERRAKARYDSQVKMGLGRVYFNLGDFTNARLQFALLFRDKVLGTGFITVPNAAGGFDNKDNPSYWEAMLLLIKTNVALKENIDGMKGLLGDQLLIYGDTIGGTRWKSEYQKIIKDLGVVVPTPVEETPATAPTPGA